MSMQSRTLDRAGRLAGELVVDALFIVRRKPWHWPAVAACALAGLAVGVVVGSVVGMPALAAVFAALIGAGLGLNIGSDFRFIARSPSRVLLYESSRVIGLPTELVRSVRPEDVRAVPAGPAMRLTVAGEAHVMARQHHARLQRMLATAPSTVPVEEAHR